MGTALLTALQVANLDMGFVTLTVIESVWTDSVESGLTKPAPDPLLETVVAAVDTVVTLTTIVGMDVTIGLEPVRIALQVSVWNPMSQRQFL